MRMTWILRLVLLASGEIERFNKALTSTLQY